MATTYQLISSVTVGSGGAANIEFTSIPGTYTDLLLSTSLRTNRATEVRDVARMQFNGNTATNYSNKELYNLCNSGTASSANETGQTGVRCAWPTAAGATANTFSNDTIYIPNYAGSNQKSISADSVAETNATGSDQDVLIAGLWNQTSAITSIKIYPVVGTTFNQYSTAYLYGIKNS